MPRFLFGALLALLALPAPSHAQAATLIVTADRIWTGDDANPWAEAVAVADDEIIAVGSRADVMRHRTAGTRMIDVPGGFVTPGFIDNHTHFARAGALLLGVNLLDVADGEGMRRRVREARDRLPTGTDGEPAGWIVGGDWGAYEAWAQGSTGREGDAAGATFDPDRSVIDPVTPNTPTVLNKWDRSAWLANAAALAAAGASCAWDGVECVDGEMTGRLSGQAVRRVLRSRPAKSMDRKLAEARAGMERLSSLGVTTIHDITGPDQFHVYEELRRAGGQTVRVYGRPTLGKWDELATVGIRHGFGDRWIKVGGLKGFVDGIMGNSSARFYEPYLTSGELGSWRDSTNTGAASGPGSGMEPPGNMLRNLIGADSTGHWPQVHAIGDAAIDTLLDLFEHVIANNPPRERRFRIIHTQVLRDASVAERMARNGIIAEVQPYHTIDDMRWMEERIGDRARWAYAFRTLHDAGVTLSFGSDWPGTNAAWYTANPMHGIYAAVARQTLDRQPEGGWFPQERIDVETALRAYTVNNAWAAGEEEWKGKLAPGMVADIVVLDRDLFEVPMSAIKDVSVVYTIVDGAIVFERRPAT